LLPYHIDFRTAECRPEWNAELPLENILDRLTGSDPATTDYVLEVPARCLQCGAEINEKTLMDLA